MLMAIENFVVRARATEAIYEINDEKGLDGLLVLCKDVEMRRWLGRFTQIDRVQNATSGWAGGEPNKQIGKTKMRRSNKTIQEYTTRLPTELSAERMQAKQVARGPQGRQESEEY